MLDRTLGRDILDQEMRMCRAMYGAILGSPGWFSWKGKEREWAGGLRQVLEALIELIVLGRKIELDYEYAGEVFSGE